MEYASKTLNELQAAGEPLDGGPRAKAGDLTVADIMTPDVITATRNETLLVAARTMSEKGVSCIVVVEHEQVVGILTDKDMLRGVAARDTDFRRTHIGEFMTSPVKVVSPRTSVMAAGKVMETQGIKRLPVVDGQALVGLVTQTDITRGLVAISPLTSVSEIMTKHVATISAKATAAEAAQAMSASGISCVVVIHRQSVAGIVTEKDLLRRVVALHKDPATTKVEDIMSFPVVSVAQTYSVLSAGKRLDRMRLHHLVVTDGNQVCGIVTQTDIMKAVRRELERLEHQRRVLAAELDSLVRYTMHDVARLRRLVSDMPDTPSDPPISGMDPRS
jgi:CBS domain-containing protein